MINLTAVDVAAVLRELADKVDSGKLRPRQVLMGEGRFEMDFYTQYDLGAARGSGKGS